MEFNTLQINAKSQDENTNDIFLNKNNKESNEEKELKNSRIENSLSLRKKKLNDYISEKRKKYVNNIFDGDVYLNKENITKNVPSLLLEEFDSYDEKLSVCHQFLTDDFTLLHGMDFNPDNVKLFILYKLINLTYSEYQEFYIDKYEEKLKQVFYDVIKIINESNNIKVLFGTTTILVNFLFSSPILNQEIIKINGIWKKFQEISELKNAELNDNLAKILINIYCNIPGVGKEYLLSNYSRYTKQVLVNCLKQFDNESKKNKINLELFESTITLIRRLIRNENNEISKENNLDVVVKLKYLYNDLVKIFTTVTSWIINEFSTKNNGKFYEFIFKLMETFTFIAKYADEETYEMREFQDNFFVSSLCSLIRIFIYNKNKELENNNIIELLIQIYDFLGMMFSFNSSKTEVYCKNKIIILTEELIKKIDLSNDRLNHKIIFFLSNYAENQERCSEIFNDNYLFLKIKEYSNNTINDQSTCNNLFCLLENGFNMGDKICKEIIIKNFTYFLEERIKILTEHVINNKYISSFNSKCKLLLSFIMFLEINIEYLELFNNMIIFLQNTNLEEYLIKLQINTKNYDQDVISNLLLKIKPK